MCGEVGLDADPCRRGNAGACGVHVPDSPLSWGRANNTWHPDDTDSRTRTHAGGVMREPQIKLGEANYLDIRERTEDVA